MEYRVEIDPVALSEVEEAYSWLAMRAPAEAVEWFNSLSNAIASLSKMPERCPLAPENDAFAEEIRQLLYGKRSGAYRVIFTVSDSVVRVLHLRHSARQSRVEGA